MLQNYKKNGDVLILEQWNLIITRIRKSRNRNKGKIWIKFRTQISALSLSLIAQFRPKPASTWNRNVFWIKNVLPDFQKKSMTLIERNISTHNIQYLLCRKVVWDVKDISLLNFSYKLLQVGKLLQHSVSDRVSCIRIKVEK